MNTIAEQIVEYVRNNDLSDNNLIDWVQMKLDEYAKENTAFINCDGECICTGGEYDFV